MWVYHKGFLSKDIILYIAFVRTCGCTLTLQTKTRIFSFPTQINVVFYS